MPARRARAPGRRRSLRRGRDGNLVQAAGQRPTGRGRDSEDGTEDAVRRRPASRTDEVGDRGPQGRLLHPERDTPRQRPNHCDRNSAGERQGRHGRRDEWQHDQHRGAVPVVGEPGRDRGEGVDHHRSGIQDRHSRRGQQPSGHEVVGQHPERGEPDHCQAGEAGVGPERSRQPRRSRVELVPGRVGHPQPQPNHQPERDRAWDSEHEQCRPVNSAS